MNKFHSTERAEAGDYTPARDRNNFASRIVGRDATLPELKAVAAVAMRMYADREWRATNSSRAVYADGVSWSRFWTDAVIDAMANARPDGLTRGDTSAQKFVAQFFAMAKDAGLSLEAGQAPMFPDVISQGYKDARNCSCLWVDVLATLYGIDREDIAARLSSKRFASREPDLIITEIDDKLARQSGIDLVRS